MIQIPRLGLCLRAIRMLTIRRFPEHFSVEDRTWAVDLLEIEKSRLITDIDGKPTQISSVRIDPEDFLRSMGIDPVQYIPESVTPTPDAFLVDKF